MVACKGVATFFFSKRTVTRAKGLLLSDTVPVSFVLFWENEVVGRKNNIAGKIKSNKNFLITNDFAEAH